MKKTCPYCGIVDYKHKCPIREAKRKEMYKSYQSTREDNIYGAKWNHLRDKVLFNSKYICLYSLYKYGTVTEANRVHHIVTVRDNKDLAFDIDNLIAVSDKAHKEIHKIYNSSLKAKIKLQETLREYNKKYAKGEYSPP
ncbi:HNH endonuclease [Clostridium perfringens]|nr:HNH endonuclease [Clostridium perfringens]